MNLILKKVKNGKSRPVPKKIQSHSNMLKICILVDFKVITSKNNEFQPKKGQNG